jgi:hypothetical protein
MIHTSDTATFPRTHHIHKPAVPYFKRSNSDSSIPLSADGKPLETRGFLHMIVQDKKTKDTLMLAYANKEVLANTLRTGSVLDLPFVFALKSLDLIHKFRDDFQIVQPNGALAS